jgi:hypothetical protein
MDGGRIDDPLHEFTLTDAERWELLHRCLRTIELSYEQTGLPSTGLTGSSENYCDVEGLRISVRKYESMSGTLPRVNLLRMEVLMPATVPDQSLIFQVPLPITLDALLPRRWGNWRDGPYVLDIMRKVMVLDDLADVI